MTLGIPKGHTVTVTRLQTCKGLPDSPKEAIIVKGGELRELCIDPFACIIYVTKSGFEASGLNEFC